MEQLLAENLSRQLKIAPEQVVREEYELLILRSLTESPLGSALVFKGGTALRLAYNSPRFSDDLDFSLIASFSEEAFVSLAEAVAREIPQVTLREELAKHFTLFALYKVREPYLPYAFSIKLEISRREETWVREQDFVIRLLTSPVTPLSALAQVATLERLRRDKESALADRRQPRDLYDLWFIAQKLRQSFTPDLSGFDRQAIRRELRKVLPRDHWQVIEQWSALSPKT
ncbi:MAG: nucleotidyl transferase AbiEii/AbiGii toxin family protein [Chloroflexota bacterium]